MPNVITTAFLNDLLIPIKTLGDTSKLKVALLTSNAAAHIDGEVEYWSELDGYEITTDPSLPSGYPNPPVGYTTGGKAISGFTLADGILDASNVQWTASTITAMFAVIYDSTNVNPENQRIIAVFDFGDNISSSSGTFEISWNDTNGIIKLT